MASLLGRERLSLLLQADESQSKLTYGAAPDRDGLVAVFVSGAASTTRRYVGSGIRQGGAWSLAGLGWPGAKSWRAVLPTIRPDQQAQGADRSGGGLRLRILFPKFLKREVLHFGGKSLPRDQQDPPCRTWLNFDEADLL